MAGKLSALLVWTVCVLAIISNGECASRQKRSVPQFALMIACAVGGNPLDYNGYGCYCGFGGGGTPVDATDRCCYNHDRCYSRMKSSGKCDKETGDVYIMVYQSSRANCGTNNPQITCKRSRRYGWLEKFIIGQKTDCAEGLCKCDRDAAICFKRNRNTFAPSYIDYHKHTTCLRQSWYELLRQKEECDRIMAGKLLALLARTVCILAIISNADCAQRHKRSVPQFGLMTSCATGENPLEYNGYGCHCGIGGGGTSVDGTDRCCYIHDRCYDLLESTGLCDDDSNDVYIMLYQYSQSNCDTANPQIKCKEAEKYDLLQQLLVSQRTECAEELCRCDTEAALCFKRNRNTFSQSFVNFDKEKNCVD
ncbi:uncharacterized protein LOC117297786 [Asterias rubens]|uniref:uncharacterized protein LOC117297786 n=1 Tax=Asterias rubens TaxID=7604 RepID=UPI001454E452|nr:uncharacterized protein LOC117297786 [Asterias rubens]